MTASDANDIACVHGKQMVKRMFDAQMSASNTLQSQIDPVPTAPEFSEMALKDEFAARSVGKFAYDCTSKNWFTYVGTRWKEDTTGCIFSEIEKTCRFNAERCNDLRQRRVLASNKTITNVEQLARHTQSLVVSSDDWNSDPMVLNTPKGVVDLRSGGETPSDPNLRLTKITAVSQSGKSCPLWMNFLDGISGADKEWQDYLKRFLGYCLTGRTSEQMFAFFYGSGANGKSVIIDTVGGIMGDYHMTASIETFTQSQNDKHPEELARLTGARLVTATETQQGRALNESRIKVLTGGDKVTARFMRQNSFEYTPIFKLLMVGNHKPQIKSVDEAMKRRIHLLPFSVTIPEANRDKDLVKKLQAEWPAILKWMVDGAIDWHEKGLDPPSLVRGATDDYFSDQDVLGEWLAAECEIGQNRTQQVGDAFQSWKAFCEARGESPGTNRRFKDSLEAKGYKQHRSSSERYYKGFSIRTGCNDYSDY